MLNGLQLFATFVTPAGVGRREIFITPALLTSHDQYLENIHIAEVCRMIA